MSREWKPGDVAMVPGVGRAMRTRDGGWVTRSTSTNVTNNFMNVRPLVVIDPEDREQVERLTEALDWATHPFNWDAMQAALRSLIAPEKPAEPQGLGAVVEDAERQTWVRVNCDPGMWRLCQGPARGRFKSYADITAVKVLSEGVTP
jgi:hypothetical protein